METPYDDIIHLPHHVSQNHPQMSMLCRAVKIARKFIIMVGILMRIEIWGHGEPFFGRNTVVAH